MADEILTGVASVEAEQGYSPLVPKKEDQPAFASASEAADSLPPSRESEPVGINVIDPATGKQATADKTLTLSQAAEIVSDQLEERRVMQRVEDDLEFQRQIDQSRLDGQAALYDWQGKPIVSKEGKPVTREDVKEAVKAAQQETDSTENAATAQPAEDQPTGDDGLTEATRTALNNPQIRQEIEQRFQQADQARQQFADVSRQTIEMGMANIYATFPELSGLSAEQMPVAMSMLQQQNPQRHGQLVNHMHTVATLMQRHHAFQQNAEQQRTARIGEWVEEQDAAFEKSCKDIPQTERDILAKEARDMLLEYGVPEDKLPELWSASILRSAPAQRILLDATRFRMAKRTATTKPVKPVPSVQKPGSVAPERPSADRARISTLEKKDSLTLKEASELISLKTRSAA